MDKKEIADLPSRVNTFKKTYDGIIGIILPVLTGIQFDVAQDLSYIDFLDRTLVQPTIVDGGKMLSRYYQEITFPPNEWTKQNQEMVERMPSLAPKGFMEVWLPRFSVSLGKMATSIIKKYQDIGNLDGLQLDEQKILSAHEAITSPAIIAFQNDYKKLHADLDQYAADQKNAQRQKILKDARETKLETPSGTVTKAESSPVRNNERLTQEAILAASRKKCGV